MNGAEETLEAERRDREVFRRVFGTDEGKSVLAWILNANNYFACDGGLVTPGGIAFCNCLLNKIGAVHGANLFADTAARVDAANDSDIKILLEREAEGEKNG
jgi:hypothetical protein